MVTELVLDMMFAIPYFIFTLIPSVPVFDGLANLADFIYLLGIGNIFFPVSNLLLYLSVWLTLSIVSLTKSFIDWILTLIPMY